MNKDKVKSYLFLHLLFAVYSVTSIFGKLAAGEPFLSLKFILFYGGEIILLGIYAIGWQQAIKNLPITEAYANRAVTVLWGFIYGALFFHESFSLLKLIGLAFVMTGIVLFSGTEEQSI